MKNNFAIFTTGEFAKLHHLNKRTLHYYDDIGIFSPKYKGENGYRYYTYEQSIELENILSLRELDMSIDDIKEYIKNPNPSDFKEIAKLKIDEINKNILHLKALKSILKEKSNMLNLCDEIYDGKIEIVDLKDEYLLMTPLNLNFETTDTLLNNSKPIMEHLKNAWEFSNYKKSCGSYISLDKIEEKNHLEYDGIFTKVDKKSKNLYKKPAGQYIRAYKIGSFDDIKTLYTNIFILAKNNNLKLLGYVFQSGLNEFAIKGEEEYITQIEILTSPL